MSQKGINVSTLILKSTSQFIENLGKTPSMASSSRLYKITPNDYTGITKDMQYNTLVNIVEKNLQRVIE